MGLLSLVLALKKKKVSPSSELTCHISLGDDSYVNNVEWVSCSALLCCKCSSQRCAETNVCLLGGQAKINKKNHQCGGI